MKQLKSLQVDKILIELLQQQLNIPFSNTEIRDAYLAKIPKDQRPGRNQLRKHIYNELLRLESAKIIERHEGSTGRGCKFIYHSKTSGISMKEKHSPFGAADKQIDSSMDDETQRALQEELSQRKVELIASIGEAEEYQRLYTKYPALRSAVEAQYLLSRERSTKLLGQLRAVESVITKIGSPK